MTQILHGTYMRKHSLFIWKSTLTRHPISLFAHLATQSVAEPSCRSPWTSHAPTFWFPQDFPPFYLPAWRKEGLGSLGSSCQRLERAGELLLASTISPGSTFSHRNNDLNGDWLPSAMGPVVQPYSGLNRLLWTGLGTFSSFVTLFPWEKCFSSSKQLTYKQTFGTKCLGKLGKTVDSPRVIQRPVTSLQDVSII